MFKSTYITSINCISPLGLDLETNWKGLIGGCSGICVQDVGSLKGIPVAKILNLPISQSNTFSFLENLFVQVATPLLVDKTINARTGFVLSTTKGNIDILSSAEAEGAELGRLAKNVASHLGFDTTPTVVSHACVSGLLAVSVAKRLIQMGQYDEVLVLAGDQVSEFVLSGFQSFQAMSSRACRPFDASRDGVTLGEAVAAVWVSDRSTEGAVEIAGEGAVNDANHISGPSRIGEGLVRSVNSALQEAGITADAIDFISAHGTATLYNDEMEAIAFDRLGLSNCPTHSLKGYYGHTLGASGLLELVIAIRCMQESTGVPTKGFEELGTSKYLNVIRRLTQQPMQYFLKTASGFGGSNAAMVLKKI